MMLALATFDLVDQVALAALEACVEYGSLILALTLAGAMYLISMVSYRV